MTDPANIHSTPASHLDRLEADAIFILREAAATARNPVMMYSIGKDSSVLLHLARKAFWPGPLPFPLLHIDTGWKFSEMYAMRDTVAASPGVRLIVHQNAEGVAAGIGPFSHGSSVHTDVMKTQALRQALDAYGFDAAIGGARRDEEASRAKERVFSFRNAHHRWDPKAQRPELWSLYNTRLNAGDSVRVFPISNWTERDVWAYIAREGIALVNLYLAAPRPVVERDGQLILAHDARLALRQGERIDTRKVRFRTLGCWPLTAAVESDADTLDAVIAETFNARTSERQGRLIDADSPSSMEKKKQEGYF